VLSRFCVQLGPRRSTHRLIAPHSKCNPTTNRLLPHARTPVFYPFALSLRRIPALTPAIYQLGLRSISLNVLNRQPTPSPMALVHMTRLEADANAHPYDIAKQVALWNELIQYPAGQKRVLSRYERLMEFDKHSSLLRSPELFQMYIRALLATNQAGAIDAAVRTRDAILSLPAPEPEPEPKPLTASQIIARDVVSAAAARPKENWTNSLRSRLTGTAAGSTAVPGGASDDPGVSGGKGSPVHVILEERESLGPAFRL